MAKDDVRRRSHQGDVRRRRDAYDRHRSARSATSPVHVVHRPCAHQPVPARFPSARQQKP